MSFRKIESTEYLTHDCLSGGDYGGFGYLARVNVEVLEQLAIDSDVGDDIAACGMNDWSLRDTIEFHAETPPALVIASGWHGSVCAYIHPDWHEGVEVIEGLENYPVIDDEAVSEYEMNAEIEAWSSWVESDLRGYVEKCFEPELWDAADEWLDENGEWLAERFLDACEKHNVYAEFQPDGSPWYRDMEEMSETIADWLKAEIDPSPYGAQRRAVRDGLIAPLFTTEEK